MKKLFKGINKTAIIVALIIAAPVIFFVYQNYTFKKQQLSEVQNKKKLNQEAYDQCLRMAFYTYRTDERGMCWRYNHDATGCDLSYFIDYKLEEKLPKDTLDDDIGECNSKHPADERLYSHASPDAEIVPFGEIEEREAFKKVMSTTEYKSFSTPPIEEGYRISYEVTTPTKDKPEWVFRLYKRSSSDEKTVATFKVDASDGTLTKI